MVSWQGNQQCGSGNRSSGIELGLVVQVSEMGLIGGTRDLDLECQMVRVISRWVNHPQVTDSHGRVHHNVIALTVQVFTTGEVAMEGVPSILPLLEAV